MKTFFFTLLLLASSFATIYWTNPTPINGTNNFTYGMVFNYTTSSSLNTTGNLIEIDGTNSSCTLSSDKKSCSYTLSYTQHILNNTYDLRAFGAEDAWCYQETANTTSSCGGLNTGTYTNSSDKWTACTGYGHTLVANYTKPANSNNAIWQVKYGTGTVSNLTLPSICTSGNVSVKFMLDSCVPSGTDAIAFYCYNGTGYQQLYNETGNDYIVGFGIINSSSVWYDENWSSSWFYSSDATDRQGGFYEEAMWWNITGITQGNETRQIPYYGCGLLNGTHSLVGNVSAIGTTSSCFYITGNNSVLDCGGYSISGDGDSTLSAVLMDNNIYSSYFVNETIRSCKVVDFRGIALDLSGSDCYNITINNNTIYNITQATASGNGALKVAYTAKCLIDNNTIYNVVNGIITGYNVTGCTISNNIIKANSSSVSLNDNTNNSLIFNNTASNGAYGISMGGSNITVINNTLYNNSLYQFLFGTSAGGTNSLAYNNIFNASSGQGTAYSTTINSLNTTKTTATNIISGRNIGGNYYSTPLMYDTDNDTIANTYYLLDGAAAYDYLPLTNLLAGYFVTPTPTTATSTSEVQIRFNFTIQNMTQCYIEMSGANYTGSFVEATNTSCEANFTISSLQGYPTKGWAYAGGVWYPTNETRQICYLACSTPGGGGGGIPPTIIVAPPPASPPPTPPSDQTPVGQVIDQIAVTAGGGHVANDPILADAIASNDKFIGLAAPTNIPKTNPINVVLAEYQGLQSLYLKLPIFDMINVGYISILFFGYLLLLASKKLGKRGFAGPAMFGVALIMLGVSMMTMLINEGLLLFATKAIGG